MKVRVKAWQDVRTLTGGIHEEEGLTALGAIKYGPYRYVDEISEEICNEMISEFERKYPDFAYSSVEFSED